MTPFVFKLGGEAGFGITSAGATLAKICTRSGYHAFGYLEYPSIIRGGYNVAEIIVGDTPARAPYKKTDCLIALNQEAITQHASELAPGAHIIYDADQKIKSGTLPLAANSIAVPFNRLAREAGGTILMRNTAALGAALALFGGDLTIFYKLIEEEFSNKKADVIKKNQLVAKAGYAFVKEHFAGNCTNTLRPLTERVGRLLVTGNEAVALGAIAAGMQFAAVYPMTPTSNILHALAPLQEEYGFIYKQPEDEISAITMAIGASFAGARSFVATAGGGFCLMTEGYGLAAQTETPIVIAMGMRGGPATGLPTWTEQGDLQFVLHAHQGDFPRIVLAPGDVEEAFHFTMTAFNLAEKYQSPVIILLDKHLCESHESAEPFRYDSYRLDRGKIVTEFKEKYERYVIAADGISPRAFPGSGNHILANSDEHNEAGYSKEEADVRVRMMEKRMQKLETCAENELPEPTIYGPKNAELTVVAWGSNKGVILDALQQINDCHSDRASERVEESLRAPTVNFLHINWVSPFPSDAVKKILSRGQKIAILECNYSGQMEDLIREKTGITFENRFRKYDGRPFFVEEVIEKINEWTDNTTKKTIKKMNVAA